MDHDPEGDGDEGQIAVPRAHGGNAQQEAENGRDHGGGRQGKPEAHAEIQRQQRRGIGADAVGGAGGEVRDVGAAQLEVQGQGQHRIQHGNHAQMQRIGVAAEREGKAEHHNNAHQEGEARLARERRLNAGLQRRQALQHHEHHGEQGEQAQHEAPVFGEQELPQESSADERDRNDDERGGKRVSGRLGGGVRHHTFSTKVRPRRPEGRNTSTQITNRKTKTRR